MNLNQRLASWAIAVLATLPFSTSHAAQWFTLEASTCQPVLESSVLPEAWDRYRSATRICPLSREQSQSAQVRLLSVFVDDYYRQLPKEAPWESFPSAMLVDPSGQCLARLPHLFPVEPPSQLVVRAGHWKQGRPTLIRLDVLNPAIGGNYRLPSLKWNQQTKRYQPVAKTAGDTPTQYQCP